MKILFLSRWFPYPVNNGSKIRIFNLLRGLADHHDVSLLSFTDTILMRNSIEPIQDICNHVQVIPWKPYRSNSIRALIGFFSKTPRALLDTFSTEMGNLIVRSIRETPPDLIIASQVDMASYVDHFSDSPALFEEAELGIYQQKLSNNALPWQHFKNTLTWVKQTRYISTLLDHFRACTVVSDAEKKLLSQVAQRSTSIVEVIPNCIDINNSRENTGVPQFGSLIFTGSLSFFANHDAMIWFVGKVLPILKSALPGIHLTITGDHANLPLPSLENVTLAGYVNDVRPMISSSWVSVAPIRLGGGTRLKILEAMALSTPVVTTSKGAEGLEVQHNVHVLIADSPEAFAEQIIRLSKDIGLRRRLVENAYQLVCEKYNWSVVMPRFLDLVEKAASQ